MAQRDNRCSCKKNERIFLCQTASSNWVLGVFWVYYKMDIFEIDHAKWVLIFQTAQGPSEPVFSLQIGSSKMVEKNV